MKIIAFISEMVFKNTDLSNQGATFLRHSPCKFKSEPRK